MTLIRVFFGLVIAVLASSASAQSGNVYERPQTQVMGSVLEGVVLQVETRQVQSTWQARGVGATIGSTVGYAVARQQSSNPAASVIGTTVGGLIGERIANQASMTDAQEIVIRLVKPHNGMDIIAIVQPAPFTAVEQGDRILVTQTSGKSRVIKLTH